MGVLILSIGEVYFVDFGGNVCFIDFEVFFVGEALGSSVVGFLGALKSSWSLF